MGNELLIDAATLVAQKGREARWLLEGVIQAGGLVLLAGETSSGKSFLALELALRVAARGSAWGLRCGVMGKVRYLCTDADEAELARRVGGLCKGLAMEVPKELAFDFGRHVFDDEQAGGLEKMIRQEEYKLVIVDPLNRYLPSMNDSSMRSVGIGLQAMREVAKRTGVTIVMVQGFNKLRQKPLGKWGEPTTDGTERVRGSTELVASCDAALLVRRGATRNVIELVKNRQGRMQWAMHFSLVDGLKGSDGSSLCLVFEALKQSEVKAPETLAELVERRIKRVMRGQAERRFGRAELVAETEKLLGKVGKRAFAEAFALLGKDSEVLVERGEQNFKIYRLAEPAKAFFNTVAEEQGNLSALDLVGKNLSVKASIMMLEKKLDDQKAAKEGKGVVEEILERLKESGSKSYQLPAD